MKKIFIAFAAMLTISAGATDQIIIPGGAGATTGKAYLKDNSGKFYPAVVGFTTDGASNVIPIGASSVTIGTVQQGPQSGTAAPWQVDLEKYLGAAFSATNYPSVRLTNGTTYIDPTNIRALNSGTDSVTITGSITATNTANGNTGSAVPAAATQVAGSDGANLRALKVSATGVLSVDGSAVTQPISGTITANAGSGTFAISAAALPLPSGASTAAGLSTINTTLGSPFQSGGSIGNSSFGISGTLPAFAATPTFNLGTLNGAATNAALVTINSTLGSPMQNSGGSVTANAGTNLNTSLLALDSSVNGIIVSQGSTTSGQKGGLILGAVTTAAPSYTTAQSSPLSMTTAGALRVDNSANVQPASQSGTWSTRLLDGNGNIVTSQLSSAQRALDVGVNVSGVQVDPRSIRALTSTDVVTANIKDGSGTTITLGQKAMASSLPVTLSSDQSALPRFADLSSTGSISALNGTINLVPNGMSTATLEISGSWVGTITFQATNDGVNYHSVTGSAVPGGALTSTTTANGNWRINTSAYTQLQIIASAWTSGSATVTLLGSSGLGILRIFQTNPDSLQMAASGNVAAGSSDSGDPVKTGAVFNSTMTAVTNGQRTNAQANQFGELAVRPRNKFTHTAGAATTTIKTGSGTLDSICLNNGTASSTITVWDNTAGSGTQIASIQPGAIAAIPFCLKFDVEFATGLTIVTAVASTDVTVTYQ